jgi:hypothetical protein
MKFVVIAKHRIIWAVAWLGDALGVSRSGFQSAHYRWVTGCPHPRDPARRVGISLYLRTGGVVLLQVGTAFVTPTEGQEYDPTDGAVTVPTGVPDVP